MHKSKAVSIAALSKLEQAQPMDLVAVFNTPPPPADEIVPGVLAGGVFGIVGPGSVGKSFLVYNLILGVTIGRDLIGGFFTSTQPGSVLYLPNEDPSEELHRRLKKIQNYLSPPDVAQLVALAQVIPLRGLNPWLMDGEGQPVLENIEWLRGVCQGKRLVILDTLRRFHVGNENDSGHMATLIGILEAISSEIGCSFAFLHHCNKSATLNGNGDNSAASRGSGVLTDNARGQFNLVGVTKQTAPELGIKEDLASWYVQLVPSKINHGRPRGAVLLQRQPGGVLMEATPDRVKDLERIMMLKGRDGILDGSIDLDEVLSPEAWEMEEPQVETVSKKNERQEQLELTRFIPGFRHGEGEGYVRKPGR